MFQSIAHRLNWWEPDRFVVASKVLHNHLRLYLSYALYIIKFVSYIINYYIMLDNMVNCIFHRNQCSITNTVWDHDLTSTKYICAKHYLCLTNIRQLFPPHYGQNVYAATQNIIFYYCNFSCLCSFLELLILVCLENYILTNHNHSFVFITLINSFWQNLKEA